ncbi:MAG: hybrid sensor histidine kinase/response regulator [Synechococcales cyanobacterium M58_A2018_015]|nr:hybrid sensor histidine kinase/response regulator [Synechococcales cyanobacterium M58_A2018_015]
MSHNKELEIQLQFLDEAQDYLSTLEVAVLGLANRGVNIDEINAALRSAHSIKGGAGMMGFETLSHLAHRLEDFFKVLKIQRHDLTLDAELEALLLAGVDCLRQVIAWERQTVAVDPHWLETHVAPLFDQLHARLGDPEAEDAHSMLSPEEGQDIVPLLFQTEVEGCLERLEAAVAAQDPCLREEVSILSQELGGLGEMLQLPAFVQLCESIAQHLAAAAADQVAEIAQLALQAWRRSQALILTGHLESLPRFITASFSPAPVASGLEGTSESACPEEQPATLDSIADWVTADASADSLTDVLGDTLAALMDDAAASIPDANPTERIADGHSDPTHSNTPVTESVIESIEAGTAEQRSIMAADPLQPTRSTPEPTLPVPDPQLGSAVIKESAENTVRVPVKQLDQLNDLFGELTIERNGLDLHLKRLRTLISTLSHRVQILEQSNAQLRDAYDKVETQTRLHRSVAALNAAPASSSLPADSPTPPAADSPSFDVLELDRYDDLHLLSQEVMETIVQVQEVTSDIELSLDDTDQTTRELNKTARQLRTKLAQVRMRPLSDITDRFPRALRELSLQHNKPVKLNVRGDHVLIDRNILEALSEPLLHLLRNAFDHGIEDPDTRRRCGKPEQGLIEIQAIHRNNRTIITIRDDGGGIPLDKIRARARQMGLDEVLLAAASDEELLSLIFEPGFSTSERVTALSGRGVGMDVVRERLKQIHGEIKVETQSGIGTTFTLSVPFTLSVTRVLIAESRRMLLAFPIDAVQEMLVVPPEELLSTAGNQAFSWEGTMVQLIRLSQWLEFRHPYQPEGLETSAAISVPTVLMLSHGNQPVGLEVDRCWGEQEVAIRKVEGDLPLPPGFSNCTILGDGRVVPLVNVPELLHWIASCERARLDAPAAAPLPSVAPTPLNLQSSVVLPIQLERQPTILIVDDSINVRRFLALTLEKAGYQVAQAKDGQEAIDKLSAGLEVQAVICDIEMPRLDGYGFLARIKSTPTLDQIPVAMLTSRSGDKHRQLAMTLGATAYFSKPYNEQVLLQTLEKILDLTPA